MSINIYVMGYKQSTILRHCAAPTLQHCYKKHVNPFFVVVKFIYRYIVFQNEPKFKMIGSTITMVVYYLKVLVK